MASTVERKPLIPSKQSIIPACDVSTLAQLQTLVKETADVPRIGAYKVGFELAMPHGLKEVITIVRDHTDRPVIYDHQKAGNDIPETGPKFATAARDSGVDAVILFPFTSPVTQSEWTKAALGEGLTVLVGGHMTQREFLKSEGGYIADDAPERIYGLAIEQGVTDFVVPGNKTEFVQRYRSFFEGLLGPDGFTLYAPGFVAQGGSITEAGKFAGDNWHAIVGSALYKASDIRQAAVDLTSQISLEDDGLQEERTRVWQVERLQSRQERVIEILEETDALRHEGHFLLKSGRHAEDYINKALPEAYPTLIAEICNMMARDFADRDIDVVVGPATGGIILATHVAAALTRMTGREVLGVYSEQQIVDGEERGVLKRDYDQLVSGKRALVIDDIVTTGGSLAKTAGAVEDAGGEVIGASVIWNRSGVGAESTGAPVFKYLVDKQYPNYQPGSDTCPGCAKDMPFDNQVGHAPKQQVVVDLSQGLPSNTA